MAASARFSLLGRFELTVDGVTIGPDDFERRSGAELLQLLALAPGHRLHREQVMEALWPGAEVESAANSLRKAATFARKATGAADAIVVRDQVVALFPESQVDVDVEIVDAARAENPDSVAAAVEAYRGDLLPDAPYAEWAVRSRDRLQRHMIALLVATRRWDDLLALDPANEEAVLAVMDRALAVGDRQTVLRKYYELESRLRYELGVTPGPAAVVLRDRALDLDGPTDVAVSGMRIFLMTGIEGSNRSGQADLDAMTATRAVHDRLIDDAVQRGGGIVFKYTGDGVCAVFGSASAAVTAAVDIQQALGAASWEHDRPRVRIGLEVGEAEHRDGDWFGAVLDQVACILDPDGDAHHVGRGPGGHLLFFGELAVGGGGRVDHQAARVAEIGHMGEQFQAVDEFDDGIIAALERHGEEAAGAFGAVCFDAVMDRRGFQPGIGHCLNIVIFLKPFRDFHRVLNVFLHPQ